MSIRTKGTILWTTGFAILVGSIAFIFLAAKGTLNIPVTPLATVVAVSIYIGGFFSGVILMCWGSTLSNDSSLDGFSQTPQVTPVKTSKTTDPWTPAPKVQVKKEKDEIPEIWGSKILTRG